MMRLMLGGFLIAGSCFAALRLTAAPVGVFPAGWQTQGGEVLWHWFAPPLLTIAAVPYGILISRSREARSGGWKRLGEAASYAAFLLGVLMAARLLVYGRVADAGGLPGAIRPVPEAVLAGVAVAVHLVVHVGFLHRLVQLPLYVAFVVGLPTFALIQIWAVLDANGIFAGVVVILLNLFAVHVAAGFRCLPVAAR